MEHLVPIEGSWGASVPYLGYVGVGMHIPGINSFDRDVLMLVSSTTAQYYQRAPIQVGSCGTDQVTSCISVKVLQSLSQSWKTAYVSTIILEAMSVSDPDFDLDQVRGRVVNSEKVTIPASQITIVKGLTMITGHHKHIHVLVELSNKYMNVFVLGNTFELKPGNSHIEVVIQNRSGSIAANIVLTTQVSNDFDVNGQEGVSSMLAQVESPNILGETSDVSNDFERYLAEA